MLTSSPKIWHVNKGDFFEHNFLTSDKWLWWRCCDQDFESARASLRYCLSKDPPKRDFLDIYLTTFSESLTSKIKSVWGSYFCSKCLKFNLDFKNAGRNWGNLFCFLDNCIWIGIVQFSLLRTGYFSLEANVLTSSPKILDVNKRDFFQLILFGSGQWIWQRVCDADFNSACARLPSCLSKGALKRDFLDICQTTFSEFVISEIQKLWGSSFFSKYSKFNLDFKNAAKNREKVFFLWDNFIWIGIVKFSLLRTGSFSLVDNVVTHRPKIWHVNKRNFFDYHFPASGQWIW